MVKKLCLPALVLVLSACQPAGDVGFTVPVGMPRQVGTLYNVNEDCSSQGDIVARIARPPSSGSVSIKEGLVHPNFATTNPRHVCNTGTVRGKQIWYTPNAGFSGTDSFLIEAIYFSGGQATLTYHITVR